MGLSQPIHEAALAIPTAPVADPAALLTGPELLAIIAQIEAAIEALDLRGQGSRIQRGATAPADALGNDLDLYLNTSNGDLYGKDAGHWSPLLNLRGLQGLPGRAGQDGQAGQAGQRGLAGQSGQNGQNGQDGQAGTDGNRITAPAAAPAPSDGQVGDLAVVASTGDLQEKTASGWVTRGNLKGPKGDAGAAGSGGTGVNADGSMSAPAGDSASLPVQTGKAGKVLRTDGTAAAWQDVQEFLRFSTFAALQAYPTTQRQAGQPGRVVADPTAANNGDYTILADAYTWQKNGTAGGFEGLTAQTSVTAGRYYEYTLVSPRIWKAKVAQAGGNVVFPVEADATDTGGAYWVEVSRSATGGGGTGYTDAQARSQAVNLLTSANKSGINFTYANGVLNATVNAAATRLYASFPAGGRNAAQVRILFGEQPGSYNVESTTGCSSITYELNGAAATLPVTLQLNDSLLISATTASTDGSVILRQQ